MTAGMIQRYLNQRCLVCGKQLRDGNKWVIIGKRGDWRWETTLKGRIHNRCLGVGWSIPTWLSELFLAERAEIVWVGTESRVNSATFYGNIPFYQRTYVKEFSLVPPSNRKEEVLCSKEKSKGMIGWKIG